MKSIILLIYVTFSIAEAQVLSYHLKDLQNKQFRVRSMPIIIERPNNDGYVLLWQESEINEDLSESEKEKFFEMFE